jgi:hypothetical protein
VQTHQPVETQLVITFVDDLRELLGVAHLVTRSKQVTRVETNADPAITAGMLDHGGQLSKASPDRISRSSRVLEQQRTVFGLRECLRECVANQGISRFGSRSLAAAWVDDHSVRSHLVTDVECMCERFEGLASHFGVVACAVDQVDGVDEDRPDLATRESRPERLKVVRPVLRGPPRTRALIEDLHRLAAQLFGAVDCPLESAR